MKITILNNVFASEFLDDATIIFNVLLENLKEDPTKDYEKETYKDQMILSHEIDYELNRDNIHSLIKDWDAYLQLHSEHCDQAAVFNGAFDLSLFSDVYEQLMGTNIYWDEDYNVYYDPSIHDKSDWIN